MGKETEPQVIDAEDDGEPAALAHEPSGVFDNDPGTHVELMLGDENVKGTVEDVTRVVPSDDYPEPGETVRFKAVGGEVEKTVAAVDYDADHPITFEEHGGVFRRTDLVEYSEQERYRIIGLDDDKEVWPHVTSDEPAERPTTATAQDGGSL